MEISLDPAKPSAQSQRPDGYVEQRESALTLPSRQPSIESAPQCSTLASRQTILSIAQVFPYKH